MWPNKLAISYFNNVIKLDILLFASYKYKLPFEVINKTFDTKEEVDTYVNEIKSMYPRIEVIKYDYRKMATE